MMAQNVINTFILAINAVLPLIHILIEKGYIHVKCGTFKLSHDKTVIKLMDTLSGHKSCVKINWMLWGWSMAQWHFVFASILLVLYVWGVIYVQKRSS
jgi:disulfide bond formation protein DsbB